MSNPFKGRRGRVAVIAVAGMGLLAAGIWLARARGAAAGGEVQGRSENWIRAIPGPVLAVAGSPGDFACYVGTARGLYQSQEGGRSWKRVFASGLWGKPVRAIWRLPGKERRVWIAVDSQVYSSEDGGIHWRPGARVPGLILCGAADPQKPSRLLIGTAGGLYESSDGGRSSRRAVGVASQGRFSGVLFDPGRAGLCVALSDQGLFRSEDAGRSWTRMTGLPLSRAEQAEDGAEEEAPEEVLPSTGAEPLQPKLAADPSRGILYVSTGQGIFRSLDGGWEWEVLPANGVEAGHEASRITVNPARPGSLFALSGSQLYSYHPAEKSWERVGSGLPRAEIYDAQWSGTGDGFWAGTEAGLFRVSLREEEEGKEEGVRGLLGKPREAAVAKAEPSVQQVQKVAIAYAEVGPDKIRRWRGLARWSAFVPSFTVGLNQGQDTNIVSSTSAGITKFAVGPDRHSRGVDFGFTWHLADFVWNPQQTNIDVRSRLTTQLRQDLLEEVTRLYFERKRILAEFEAQPIEDSTLRKERALRVQELTAYLDALTGGWFSENLESA